MANILPFQRTGQLVAEIDEFLDKALESSLVAERAMLHYAEHGADPSLEERVEQIMAVEARADELRRSIANVMYSEMLMPDTRGDVLTLLDEVDTLLDDNTHMLVHLAIELPELPTELSEGFQQVTAEAGKAVQAVLLGARAYFKEPHAVRDHVHRTNFHATEASKVTLRTGKAIFGTGLPLAEKRQLLDFLLGIRGLASVADDVGDRLAIYAVKRSL